jgi:hypothetical protein
VIALDGLDGSDLDALREVEELTSSTFGPSLAVVVAADESTWNQISKTSNRRQESPIGRRAVVVAVDGLKV